MTGWTSPEATALHQAVGAVPRGLERRWRRSVLGQARVLQQHQDPRRRRATTVVRLETFDAHRGRLPGATLRFTGPGAVGLVSEGDWLEATGWRWRGIVRARRASNHSTGATYAWIPTKPAMAVAALLLVLLVGAPIVAAARRAGSTISTTGSTLPPGPDLLGGGDSTTTTDRTRSTETSLANKPTPLGDPDAAALPAEHRAKTIGPEGATRVRAYAAEKNVAWAPAAKAVIGDVAKLEPERRAAFVTKAVKAHDDVQACLGEDGATWDSCTAARIGTATELAKLRPEHRLAVIEERAELVAWTAECVNGDPWAFCALQLMGKVSESNEPYTYDGLKAADPALVEQTLDCVEERLDDTAVRDRWVACGKAAYTAWEEEQEQAQAQEKEEDQ